MSQRINRRVLRSRGVIYSAVVEPLEGRRLLSGTLTTLAAFSGTNGSYPQGGLVADSAGNLYGTTSTGGADGDGTVYEIAAGTGTVTTIASFDGTNGDYPVAGLKADSAGNLYGTTEYGGASNVGTVFKVAAGSGTITTLGTFDATNSTVDGFEPDSALVTDSAGNLYGRTAAGGADDDGTLFEVPAAGGTITTLASLDGTNKQASGVSEDGNLTIDSAGNLYGTIYAGGTAEEGTVFELTAGAGTITTLATFDYTDGEQPASNLVIDSAGNLYGTTGAGGASYEGTVFEIAAGSGTVTTLATFDDTNGYDPLGNLVTDSSGNLYGTSYGGGASEDGTIFEVATGSGTITSLATFNSTNGNGPTGLTSDSAGDLFGTTYVGGASNEGTAFELPATTTGGGSGPGGGSASSGVGLVPTIVSDSVPATAVAGQPIKGVLKLKLTDSLATPEKGYAVTIFASPTATLDSSTATLVTNLKKTSTIKAGKAVTLSVSIKDLSAGLVGTYYLIAETADLAGNVPYAVSSATVAVAAPYVALSGSLSAVKPATIAVGKSGSVVLTLTNTGNIAATGSLVLTLSPSADGSTAVSAVTLTSTTIRTTIKQGKTGKFTLHFKVPATLAAGVYYPLANLSLDGVSTAVVGSAFMVG